MKRPIIFGKYLLLERVNVGGMAEVFIAKAFGVEGFERIVAIKRILPTMAEDLEFIQMFLDEARISVQLNHPNIVHIHDLGKHDTSYYIAMAYVAGRDVRAILERYRRQREIMPTAQAVYIASRICRGLDYAHRKKDALGQDLHIIHRDVSPQNILVSYQGEVKIIDFGIAKAANRSQKTQAGILKGKFGYMSPEQVRGLPIDRRSDIFAVGVILYEMLTGEKLFVGESDFSTLEKVRNAEVPSPRKLNPAVPAGLEKVMLKALAREQEDRYQWASELEQDLLRFLMAGDATYSPRDLSLFLKQAFGEDLLREEEKMERYSAIERPEQLESTGVTARTDRRRKSGQGLAAADGGGAQQEVYIPPPTREELAEMGGGSDPTEVVRPGHLRELDLRTVVGGSPFQPEGNGASTGGLGPGNPAELRRNGEEKSEPNVTGRGPSFDHTGETLAPLEEGLPLPPSSKSGHKPQVVIGDAEGCAGATVIGPTPKNQQAGGLDRSSRELERAPRTTRSELEPAPTAPRQADRLRVRSARQPTRSISSSQRRKLWIAAGGLVVLAGVTLVVLLRLGEAQGTLLVSVRPAPGAEISVAGHPVQNDLPFQISPGTYEVTARGPGHRSTRREVTVAEGDNPPLSIKLEPIPAPAPPSEPPVQREEPEKASAVPVRVEEPARPTEVPVEAPRRLSEPVKVAEPLKPAVRRPPPPPKAPSLPRAKGKLACRSRSAGAEVWIDGKKTDRLTPVPLSNPIELAVGIHRVSFKLEGKFSGPFQVEVKEGATAIVREDLE